MPPGRGQLSLSALLEAAAASNPPTRCQSSPKPGPSSCRALPGPPTTHPRLSVDQLARQLRDLCVEPTCLLLLTESYPIFSMGISESLTLRSRVHNQPMWLQGYRARASP